MDQRQRAAPHGFSQLATSCFACSRLGIPRAPLLRLASVPKSLPKGRTLNNTASPHTHFTFPPSFIGARFSSTLSRTNRKACFFLDLSKPKFSNTNPHYAEFCSQRYYCIRAEPL